MPRENRIRNVPKHLLFLTAAQMRSAAVEPKPVANPKQNAFSSVRWIVKAPIAPAGTPKTIAIKSPFKKKLLSSTLTPIHTYP